MSCLAINATAPVEVACGKATALLVLGACINASQSLSSNESKTSSFSYVLAGLREQAEAVLSAMLCADMNRSIPE